MIGSIWPRVGRCGQIWISILLWLRSQGICLFIGLLASDLARTLLEQLSFECSDDRTVSFVEPGEWVFHPGVSCRLLTTQLRVFLVRFLCFKLSICGPCRRNWCLVTRIELFAWQKLRPRSVFDGFHGWHRLIPRHMFWLFNRLFVLVNCPFGVVAWLLMVAIFGGWSLDIDRRRKLVIKSLLSVFHRALALIWRMFVQSLSQVTWLVTPRTRCNDSGRGVLLLGFTKHVAFKRDLTGS